MLGEHAATDELAVRKRLAAQQLHVPSGRYCAAWLCINVRRTDSVGNAVNANNEPARGNMFSSADMDLAPCRVASRRFEADSRGLE